MPFLQDKKKKDDETAEAASTGMSRAARAAKEKPDTVKGVQDYAMREMERERKEAEEKKKKKKTGVDTAPTKGILERIYDSVMGTSEKK